MKKILLLTIFSCVLFQSFAQSTFQRFINARNGIQNGTVIKVSGGRFLYTGTTTNRTSGYVFASLVAADGSTIWSKFYADSTMITDSRGAIQTSDGGFIITAISSYSISDFKLLKIDAYGNLLWSKDYKGFSYFIIRGVTASYDGNVTIAGYTDTCAVIMKINQITGGVAWMKTFSVKPVTLYDGLEQYDGITATSDGGYLAGGLANGIDMLISKYNKDGIVSWTKIIRPTAGTAPSYNVILVCRESGDGGYVFGGTTRSNISTGVDDLAVLKTDKNGNLEWARQFDNSTYEGVWDMVRMQDSSFILLSQYSLSKVNKNGFVDWLETTGLQDMSNYFSYYSICKTNDNGFMVTQKYKDSSYLTKFNSAGNTCNTTVVSHPVTKDIPYSVYPYTIDTTDASAKVQVVTSSFGVAKGKSLNILLCQSTLSSQFAVATAIELLKDKNQELSVKLYPNPVATDLLYININNSKPEILTLLITNMEGKVVQSQTIVSNSQYSSLFVNISSLPKGMYMVTVRNAHENKTVKFVKE